MPRIRYSVAASLDGYIAGPDGEFDWIPMDPDIDFGALINEFDTIFAERKSFEFMAAHGEPSPINGLKTYVFSRTLPEDTF